jgi:hypothetical protein
MYKIAPTVLLLLAAITVTVIYSSNHLVSLQQAATAFSVLIHEAGHTATAFMFGLKVVEIDIYAAGGHTISSGGILIGWRGALHSLSGFFFTWGLCFFLLLSCAAFKSSASLPTIILAFIVFMVSAFAVDQIVTSVIIFGLSLFFIAFFVINPLRYYIIHVLAFILLTEIFRTNLTYIWMGIESADAYKAAQHLDIHYVLLALFMTSLILILAVYVARVWLKIGLFELKKTKQDEKLWHSGTQNHT